MFGKLVGIQGNVLKIALDEDLNTLKVNRFANGKQPTVELEIADNRKISPDQRKKIFALIVLTDEFLPFPSSLVIEVIPVSALKAT